jgi:hypothetical protein
LLTVEVSPTRHATIQSRGCGFAVARTKKPCVLEPDGFADWLLNPSALRPSKLGVLNTSSVQLPGLDKSPPTNASGSRLLIKKVLYTWFHQVRLHLTSPLGLAAQQAASAGAEAEEVYRRSAPRLVVPVSLTAVLVFFHTTLAVRVSMLEISMP